MLGGIRTMQVVSLAVLMLALLGMHLLAFLEAFRDDSLLMLGGIRTMQVVSLAVLMLALLGMHLLATRPQVAERPGSQAYWGGSLG